MNDNFAKHKTATPYPGAPRYFKRIWKGYGEALVIYGFACRSEYAEDADQERYSWEEQRSFLCWAFSPAEPLGEIGFTPVDDVVEISEAQFVAAHENNWPQDVGIEIESITYLDS